MQVADGPYIFVSWLWGDVTGSWHEAAGSVWLACSAGRCKDWWVKLHGLGPSSPAFLKVEWLANLHKAPVKHLLSALPWIVSPAADILSSWGSDTDSQPIADMATGFKPLLEMSIRHSGFWK